MPQFPSKILIVSSNLDVLVTNMNCPKYWSIPSVSNLFTIGHRENLVFQKLTVFECRHDRISTRQLT